MAEIRIPEIKMQVTSVRLIGRTPLFCNRMSAKAKQQLLVGGKRKTAAERQLIKHDPMTEYRASMLVEPSMDTRSAVMFPAVAFKGAMATAALVVAGIRKTDVQRLVYIPEEYVPIFGIPKLRMDVVRSADIGKTPDIRTRAFFPEWGTELTIEHASDTLGTTSILALLHNAGIVCGVGDFRQEKGKGGYGTFRILDASEDFPEYLLDKDAQREAIENPVMADQNTRELWEMYEEEVASRQ